MRNLDRDKEIDYNLFLRAGIDPARFQLIKLNK